MYLNAKINDLSLVALIDTGASGVALISKSFCDQLQIIPYNMTHPINLVGFEETKCTQITQQVSFSLAIGRHREQVSAYVLCLCKHDLILGLPWLEKHNPYVNWKENTITFGETCLGMACCQFETTLP